MALVRDGEPTPTPEDSQILRQAFGSNWRLWRLFRQQFTPTSLSAIGTILIACGGYIVKLRHDVDSYHQQVIIYRTEVAPVLRDSKLETDNHLEIEGLKGRVTRLEESYDTAYREAGSAPVTHPHKTGQR